VLEQIDILDEEVVPVLRENLPVARDGLFDDVLHHGAPHR
jgi:hypothetical protein